MEPYWDHGSIQRKLTALKGEGYVVEDDCGRLAVNKVLVGRKYVSVSDHPLETMQAPGLAVAAGLFAAYWLLPSIHVEIALLSVTTAITFAVYVFARSLFYSYRIPCVAEGEA